VFADNADTPTRRGVVTHRQRTDCAHPFERPSLVLLLLLPR